VNSLVLLYDYAHVAWEWEWDDKNMSDSDGSEDFASDNSHINPYLQTVAVKRNPHK
jgi:hypothetical protein